jgi:hypothetical protein
MAVGSFCQTTSDIILPACKQRTVFFKRCNFWLRSAKLADHQYASESF